MRKSFLHKLISFLHLINTQIDPGQLRHIVLEYLGKAIHSLYMFYLNLFDHKQNKLLLHLEMLNQLMALQHYYKSNNQQEYLHLGYFYFNHKRNQN